MDKLSVLLFSLLREKVGSNIVTLKVSLPAEAGAVLDVLASTYPVTAPYRPVMRLAVNQEYADEDSKVLIGDELAVITPVSGG